MILEGRSAIVTGSSRGIGAAIAKTFAENGAQVVINYLRSEDKARELLSEIISHGGKAIMLKADVSKREEVEEMVKITLQEFGKIDILVNNAFRLFNPKPFSETEWEDFQKQIDVTLKGAFNCIKAVMNDMINRKSGKIINILSMAFNEPVWGYSGYAAAKGGLVALSRYTASELGPNGITVNMVAPGMTYTDATVNAPEELKKELANRTALRRNAYPEDIAGAALFFASDISNFVTGVYLPVCGGYIFV